MTQLETLKLALEALEANQPVNYCMNNNGEKFPMMQEDPFKVERNAKAITALRQAIDASTHLEQAQAEIKQSVSVEPVAGDWSVFNTGAEVWSGLSLTDAVAELTPDRFKRGWSAVCVINKDNPPIYTSPPQRQPLTDEQISDLVQSTTGITMPFYKAFVRAIEAAHGIKGEA